MPLASGIIFQVDQAAPANQGVLWDQRHAVKTQIWIAVSVYVLVAIIRKRLGLEMSLYQILQIFSITLLEKMPISCVLEAFDSRSELLDNSSQLILFEF
jgi:hypothetical protein